MAELGWAPRITPAAGGDATKIENGGGSVTVNADGSINIAPLAGKKIFFTDKTDFVGTCDCSAIWRFLAKTDMRNTLTLTALPSAATAAYQAHVSGDSVNRLIVLADGKMQWGPGNAAVDTNLYRNAANELKTDDDFTIGGALNHDGSTVGFYATAPISQQTGVAVTAAGVHAACVAVGLFTA